MLDFDASSKSQWKFFNDDEMSQDLEGDGIPVCP